MQAPDPYSTSQRRWQALAHRDPGAHSSFIYGVISTKVYCRPTCTARLARRANVQYFEDAAQAQSSGFRPCKRCKPDEDTFIGDTEDVVLRVLALLPTEQGYSSRGLKHIARDVGVTPSYLCRVFKRHMGTTIGNYVKDFEQKARPAPPASTSYCSSSPDILGLAPTPVGTILVPDESASLGDDIADFDPNFDDWLYNLDLSIDGEYRWLWDANTLGLCPPESTTSPSKVNTSPAYQGYVPS